MSSGSSHEETKAPEKAHFQTTHWSVVLAAGQSDSPSHVEALEKLCRAYWYPIYAHVRRRGHGPEDAQDLTQEFLARLLEKNWLADLDMKSGRFRAFLLTALNRFLINEYDRGQAAKRGGGKTILSLDHAYAEGRFLGEPATDETPEKIFDERWALAVLDRALARLREEIVTSGKSQLFDLLNPFLSHEAEAGEYAAIAAQLGLTSGAIGVAVHRLRQRYREIVRDEIANTVTDPAHVDEEMRHLFAALRRRIAM